VRNAGTSASVFCELHGATANLGACRLENASDNFSRGRKDVFAVRGSDIGELQQLLLWHDGGGLSPDWHVQQVEVQHPLLQKSWILPCGQWLRKGQETPLAADSKGAGSAAADAHAAAAAAAAKAVGVQPGCLVMLAPGAAAAAAGDGGQRLVSYKVEVQTSDVRGAGTDAGEPLMWAASLVEQHTFARMTCRSLKAVGMWVLVVNCHFCMGSVTMM
jgi:hypothetical protein